jgi:hypothetical protein
MLLKTVSVLGVFETLTLAFSKHFHFFHVDFPPDDRKCPSPVARTDSWFVLKRILLDSGQTFRHCGVVTA